MDMSVNEELFELINQRLEFLKKYCTERNQIDTQYQTAKEILIKIQNAPFKDKYLTYFKKGKTLLLREICKELGFDYWEKRGNLHLSNAIDRLDSISCRINSKKNGIKYG